MLTAVALSRAGYVPEGCERILYAWAPGSETFAMPAAVHMRLGAASQYQSVLIQMHYNNVDGVSDETDSSAIEVYYTDAPREHACAASQSSNLSAFKGCAGTT